MRLTDLTSAAAGGRFIRAEKLLGFANRRLYRQSRVYSLKIDIDIDSDCANQGVDVYVLRDNWDLHGAYKYAMKHYYNAMKEEIQNAKGADTRWHDFRVMPNFQADELTVEVNNPDSSNPVFSTNKLSTGDVDFSTVVDSTGTTKAFGLDASTTSTVYSIIAEWKSKDRVHADPASSATNMAYGALVEDLDEANYDILKGNGAGPPYDDEANGNLWHKVATLKQTTPTGVSKLTSGFIDAPLGLVVLVSNAFTTTGAARGASIVFQSGSYKGVKAAPYATPILTPEMEYEVV